jgi:hypothetical protein
MISTVTTATVSVVMTVAIASSLALVSIITLLVLLIQRELIVRLSYRQHDVSALTPGSGTVSRNEAAGVSEMVPEGKAQGTDAGLAYGPKVFTFLGRALIIGILPLLMAFVLIIGVKVVQVLK